MEVPIGKLLVMGSLFHVTGPALTLAAGMSVQSPFVRAPSGSADAQLAAARAELLSVHGDPFSLLNVFGEWLRVRDGRGDSRKWCRRRGVEEHRLVELAKLQRQFQARGGARVPSEPQARPKRAIEAALALACSYW